jgi:hypothetical protein
VAPAADRTMGVRSSNGSAASIASMRGPVGAEYFNPLSM